MILMSSFRKPAAMMKAMRLIDRKYVSGFLKADEASGERVLVIAKFNRDRIRCDFLALALFEDVRLELRRKVTARGLGCGVAPSHPSHATRRVGRSGVAT